MMQSVVHRFPDVWVKYKFKCRNEGIIWTERMVERINQEIDHYCTLMLTKDELEWISKLRYIKKDFVEFLRIYRPQREHIKVTNIDGHLDVVVEGPWFLTILFEVPILAIVNEVYFDETVLSHSFRLAEFYKDGADRLKAKIDIAAKEQFLFSDFGTRRRLSGSWQEFVVAQLAKELPRNVFGGTSNMYLAKKYNLTPIGTMAHEYICVGQALEGVTLASSQKYMLQAWVDEYRGDLGTALSDTLGTDKFLEDFDLYFAKLYDGVRHDSGDPIAWGERMIKHYETLRIDPKNKQLVFSDSLDFEKAAMLNNHFKDRAKVSFGIGTNLTNDFEEIIPLNIVMKVVAANNRPVAKISDNPGKTMCEDQGFLTYLHQVTKVK
jgi:nicotinate phosphoribosyltransferase